MVKKTRVTVVLVISVVCTHPASTYECRTFALSKYLLPLENYHSGHRGINAPGITLKACSQHVN